MKRTLPAMRLTIWKKLICVCALIHLMVSHLGASEEQEKPAQQEARATKRSPYVENWTQWRGPRADGHAGERARPPIQWDKEKNMAWVAELPGEGSATPIVYGNQVFVLSAVKTERKSTTAVINDERAKTTPDEMYYQFVVSSYDRNTGQVLWQRVAIEQVPHEGKHETNTYAAGSPTTDGQRLYFSFGSRGTFCYSLDGELIWKIDLGAMRTRNGWGEAITPTLTDDSLIINRRDPLLPPLTSSLGTSVGRRIARVRLPRGTPLLSQPMRESNKSSSMVPGRSRAMMPTMEPYCGSVGAKRSMRFLHRSGFVIRSFAQVVIAVRWLVRSH